MKSTLSEEDLKKAWEDLKQGKRLPFYTEHHALKVKTLLDKLHGAQLPMKVVAMDLKASTLRLHYYQGAKYLLENLDPDGQYRSLYNNTICRTYPSYIEFHIKPRQAGLEDAQVNSAWREELEAFIETAAPNDKLFLPNVALTPEDIIWAQAQIAPLIKEDGSPYFFGKIEKNVILLIKDA